MVQGPSVYVLPEPDIVWMYMTSAKSKISWIKNFANVGITAKSAKILLRENFPLYGIYACTYVHRRRNDLYFGGLTQFHV